MDFAARHSFSARHIGPSPDEQQRMLAVTGHASLDELTAAALPPGLADPHLDLPPAASEAEALAELRRLAGRNTVAQSMIGLGYYGTITPAVIRRNVLENPAWYTAYTPYQPEISQGRLEALLTFQTMVEDLTALPVAGASLLDEATAAAEAMTLARRSAGKGRDLPGRRGLPAADAGRAGHPGRAARHRAGHRPGHRGPDRGAARGRAVRRAAALPRGQRPGPRPGPGHRGRARAWRAGRGGGRPARADPARPAGRAGRGHRGGQHPAVRRADGLRRPARGLHRGPRRAAPAAARAAGRRVPGRRRQARLPARAAGPRAAHPPGEGDQQHLHRPGAAGRDGRHVRGLPRPGRAGRHRP